ncbi:hypothetical protein BDF19DRAFT_181945 [Syncephalis fuscata]|nr:hypothetical protein BDF19DRAFT_181945 [Syncephalis fuscata]
MVYYIEWGGKVKIKHNISFLSFIMTDDYLNQQALQLLPDSSCIRKLCTTRAVSSGDIVFVSDPLASVLLAEEVTRRCHACLQEAVPNDTGNDKAEDSPNSLMHCGGCHYALYCDTACQRIAWPRHRLECRYRQQRHLAILLGNDPELLLLLRTCDLLKMNN